MFVLWACAFALVVAYYNVPTATRLLQPIFDFQINGGWMAAVVNRVVFCGFLPGLFLLALAVNPSSPFAANHVHCL